jgi:very-short-patch-repair endonuclease
LVAVLPGVYTAAGRAQERAVRVLALGARQPDAVLVGRTAAQLSFWPGLSGDVVSYALGHKCRAQPGFDAQRRTVVAELVGECGPVRLTVPALTALDLCDELGGDGIDQALRTRSATLAGMHPAFELSPGRRGNRDRRMLLLDSRDEPWSAAERLCHRLLRGARISGWKSNWPVSIAGSRYYLDVAFPALRIVLEIDGRLHERDEDVFENDRRRQNALVLDGWLVLRFTWRVLTEHPDQVLEAVRLALALRGAEL